MGELDMNTIADKTCRLLTCLMGGARLDRHDVARELGTDVAAADRYIRSVAVVPGVATYKTGRRLMVAFSFSNALRKAVGL
jgi:hypothetical protein